MVEKITYILLIIICTFSSIFIISNKVKREDEKQDVNLKDKFMISKTNINVPVVILYGDNMRLNQMEKIVALIDEMMEVNYL